MTVCYQSSQTGFSYVLLIDDFFYGLVEVGVVIHTLPKEMIYLQRFLKIFYGVRDWSITGRGGGGGGYKMGGGGEVKY